MSDKEQIVITVSGPQGPARSEMTKDILVGLHRLAKGRDTLFRLHRDFQHQRHAFQAVDGAAGGLEIGLVLRQSARRPGFPLVLRTQNETPSPPQPNTCDQGKVTISPHSVRSGDRVRIVVEGTAERYMDQDFVTIDGWSLPLSGQKWGGEIELLHRPAKPLGPGERVGWSKMPPNTIGRIIWVDQETNEAWVRWENENNPRDYSTVKVADLHRA